MDQERTELELAVLRYETPQFIMKIVMRDPEAAKAWSESWEGIRKVLHPTEDK